MQDLLALVGRERPLQEVARAIFFHANAMNAPAVGAFHVTCSDETEGECADVFQQLFVQYLLPSLKLARRAPFRTANLGGRYEWGGIRLAEAHFAAPVEESAGKVIVAKINSHVGWEQPEPLTGSAEPLAGLGVRRRYGRELPCCGALRATIDGAHAPWADELREAFESEGRDRLAELNDDARVAPPVRALCAAATSARLQARKVILDLQDYTPDSPTYFMVLPCVTVNRPQSDGEILCGVYVLDGREGGREATYSGLGDVPSAYRVEVAKQRLHVTDDNVGNERAARDHRAAARTAIRTRLASLPALRDERLERIRRDVAQNAHRQHHHARALLKLAIPVLAAAAPVPAAVLAFSEGAVGMHHAFRVQKLASALADDEDARQILDELHRRIDTMDSERAEALVELLVRDYQP